MMIKSTPLAFFLCLASASASDTIDGFPTDDSLQGLTRKRNMDTESEKQLEEATAEIDRLTRIQTQSSKTIATQRNMLELNAITIQQLRDQVLELLYKTNELQNLIDPNNRATEVTPIMLKTYQDQIWRDENKLNAVALSKQDQNKL